MKGRVISTRRRRISVLSIITLVILTASVILSACATTTPVEEPAAPPADTSEDTTTEEVTTEEVTTEEEPVVEDSKSGGVLIAAYQTDPVGFDPAVVGSMSSYLMIELSYDTLVEYDEDMMIVPSLAEDWEISDDNLEITMFLRQGAKFHDGQELSSEDVKFTFDRIKDEDTGSPRLGVFENLDSVEVVDTYTVKFVFNTEMGPFWAHLASAAQSIVQAAKK